MFPPIRNATSRREAMAVARQSRRPSRLGAQAGAAGKPDVVLDEEAGFPGLLARAWQRATAAPDLASMITVLLTLDGHLPPDVSRNALTTADECALAVLSELPPGQGEQPAFLGRLGLTRTGRITLEVPSGPPPATTEDLVAEPVPVPWPRRAVSEYAARLNVAVRRHDRSCADCRAWLAAMGGPDREELLDQLKDAALRTAPFILYQGETLYTNFREHNNLTGKTLSPGHPDCVLSRLSGLPLPRWSDSEVQLVVCLALLVRSGGYGRIEEANGVQLTIDRVAGLLDRIRRLYNGVADGVEIPSATSDRVTELDELARALKRRRTELVPSMRFYRAIHGPSLHKVERIAAAPGGPARQREAELCARLSTRLPVGADTLDGLTAAVDSAPSWLCRPHGDFGTGLESLVYETVSAATEVFEADFAMSRGMRSPARLMAALRAQDWSTIVGWELPEYFCCVVPASDAARCFGGSTARLADVAWSISARMQYNSWHFVPGNLPKVKEVAARDYFVPPTMPDVSYYSDQHHRGHVAARVRYSIRSPQPVEILGRVFAGFVDLRLLRCDGTPFAEQDLIAAHRVSALIAAATTASAAQVAHGASADVEAFDSRWHWTTITGSS
jgi:hypothetical protein